MRKNVFIDTGGFIAFFNQDDKNHELAKTGLQKLITTGCQLITSDYVLDELISWMRCKMKISTAQIIKYITQMELADIEIISPTKELFSNSLKTMAKYNDHYFSFTDCMSFQMMKELNIRFVFTTDKHFAIAGFENVM